MRKKNCKQTISAENSLLSDFQWWNQLHIEQNRVGDGDEVGKYGKIDNGEERFSFFEWQKIEEKNNKRRMIYMKLHAVKLVLQLNYSK